MKDTSQTPHPTSDMTRCPIALTLYVTVTQTALVLLVMLLSSGSVIASSNALQGDVISVSQEHVVSGQGVEQEPMEAEAKPEATTEAQAQAQIQTETVKQSMEQKEPYKLAPLAQGQPLQSPAASGNTSFLLLSSSIGAVRFRDQATSPLFYNGILLNYGLGWMHSGSKHEFIVMGDVNLGLLSGSAPSSSFFQTYSEAYLFSSDLYTHYLRQLKMLSVGKFSFHAGGALRNTLNVRMNTNLGNNGAGIEDLLNLMLAARVNYDISRLKTKTVNWYLFTRTLQPQRRQLSLQFNAGVLNFNYRPGYAYLVDAELDGTETNIIEYLLGGHQWSLNGWRFNSSLSYTTWRSTGNGIRWSYHWDVAHAPGRYESFQYATHSIRFSLLFNNAK